MFRAWKPVLVGFIAVLLFVVWPFIYFRWTYDHGKRLRTVEPGHFYRSGQMTAEGFRDAVRELGLKTIINVQDDVPDPALDSFWSSRTIRESELCRELGVRYVNLAPDLVERSAVPESHPGVIDQFLKLMDDPEIYPALIHCRAGLHRTGVLCAVYRMEYDGWSNLAAFQELKAHGFGEFACTAANEYVNQYVIQYRPRPHKKVATLGRH
jgi:tyrosine-protein phosphatase SIW14